MIVMSQLRNTVASLVSHKMSVPQPAAYPIHDTVVCYQEVTHRDHQHRTCVSKPTTSFEYGVSLPHDKQMSIPRKSPQSSRTAL